MPVQKLRKFLDDNKVKYVTISHSPAFTAQDIAAAAHISGKEMAKTVIVKIDGETAMVVLPGSMKVDFGRLLDATGAREVELATEREFRDRFPDCALGTMPPFGNLYGMDVYVAEELTEDTDIIFNAGSTTELIKMAFQDYQRLVKPHVLPFHISV
jgi:Ala-tRNA(Pro) deacylase